MKTEIPGGHSDHLKLGSEQIKMLSSLRKTVVNVGLTCGARQILYGMDLDTIGLYSEKRPGEFPPPKAALQRARVTLRPF